MKTYSISQLARLSGLSRSTLLYYDRLGLLHPRGRTTAGYRFYTTQDHRRLERIRHFREGGLTLKEIRTVLASGGKPGTKLLEKRLQEASDQIVDLKKRQRILVGMWRKVASGKRPAPVDKQLWVVMLQAAGMDKEAMNRWHTEFERRAPDGHQEFLLSLGIPAEEAARIRRLSQDAVH